MTSYDIIWNLILMLLAQKNDSEKEKSTNEENN